MPQLVGSSKFIVRRNRKNTTNYQLLTTNCKSQGFTLIEIVLSLFLILAIVTILFAASGTFISSRATSLQGIAAKIASREIENLRNTNFASLPASGTISDSDITKLPQGTATRTIADYQGSSQIKQVTIKVSWVEKTAPKEILLETLISENGL